MEEENEKLDSLSQVTEGECDDSNTLVDEIADSLSDDGFGVFHGREFVSIREDVHIAPNSTVSKQYFDGKEAVMLAYNDADSEIVLIPLEGNYDRPDVHGLQRTKNQATVAASGFLKKHGIETDTTIRYTPTWDDDIGGDQVSGGLRIDMTQDGEPTPMN